MPSTNSTLRNRVPHEAQGMLTLLFETMDMHGRPVCPSNHIMQDKGAISNVAVRSQQSLLSARQYSVWLSRWRLYRDALQCRLSPLSQKVTLREIREGAGRSLADCLRMEFRMVHHCCTARTDFVEGVSALLIDKRGRAKWDPPRIEQVWCFPNTGVRITSACFT